MNKKKITICEVILEIRSLVDTLYSTKNKITIKKIHELAEEAELYAKKMSKKLHDYAGESWGESVFKSFRNNKSLRTKYPFKYIHLL